MKIKSIKISNMFSFEQKENIDECQEIIFDTKLNILIGPNGSGKSNFIEILNKLFRSGLILGCQFNEAIIEKHKAEPKQYPLHQALTKRDVYHNIIKNYKSINEIKLQA